MKNLVKFTALAVAMFGASSVASAQVTPATQSNNVLSGASITAKATVETAISATGVTDLNFGTIYRNGGGKTIAATAATAGVFTIIGPAGSTPTVAFTAPSGGNLTGTASALNLLGVTLSYATAASTAACSAATAFTSGTITLDGVGGAKMCVGGVTAAPSNTQALDSYTGTVAMTVTFP